MEDTAVGVVVLGHGSRVPAANEPLFAIAAMASDRLGGAPAEAAFLQMASPTLSEAVEKLCAGGVRSIHVVPFFLYPGAHVTEDIPAEVQRLRGVYPSVNFILAGHLGVHPLMADIVAALVGAGGTAKD